MNKELLISFKEYMPIKHGQPYFYTIEFAHQILYYFGAEHTKDPTHPQFKLMEEKWQEFLRKTPATKLVVIVEGNTNVTEQTTLIEAIKKYGESGAAIFWAKQAHVTSVRPEPSIKDEAEKLLKDFSREEVFYFYTIRGIVSWQRGGEQTGFDEFIRSNIKRYKDVLCWPGFDFSFELIKNIHRKIFSEEFNLDDKGFIAKIPNPTFDLSIINEIARMSSTIRNISILDYIEGYWQEGHTIFIVYGASHAVMQEPAIKSLVKTGELPN